MNSKKVEIKDNFVEVIELVRNYDYFLIFHPSQTRPVSMYRIDKDSEDIDDFTFTFFKLVEPVDLSYNDTNTSTFFKVESNYAYFKLKDYIVNLDVTNSDNETDGVIESFTIPNVDPEMMPYFYQGTAPNFEEGFRFDSPYLERLLLWDKTLGENYICNSLKGESFQFELKQRRPNEYQYINTNTSAEYTNQPDDTDGPYWVNQVRHDSIISKAFPHKIIKISEFSQNIKILLRISIKVDYIPGMLEVTNIYAK